jgi:hypothetical protein
MERAVQEDEPSTNSNVFPVPGKSFSNFLKEIMSTRPNCLSRIPEAWNSKEAGACSALCQSLFLPPNGLTRYIPQ